MEPEALPDLEIETAGYVPGLTRMVVPAVAALMAVGMELNGLPDEPLPPLAAPASTNSAAPETGAAVAMVATAPVSAAEPTIPAGSLKVSETSYVVPG